MSLLSSIARGMRQRWVYGSVAFITALGIGLATPQVAQAFSLFDLLFNGVQYIQLANMSDQQEVQLGQRINQQLVTREFRLSRNASINNYVKEIGERLMPSSERPNLPYSFQVVQDDSINAFATMGGFTYVTTGLIRAADNEAELAGVIGHEMGHIDGRHAVNQMRQAALTRGVAGALGVRQDALVGIGVDLALRLPNSRADEFDADRRGFRIMGGAGYDQQGSVTFMQKLASRGRSAPNFLSTHPAASDRVRVLQDMVDTDANPEAIAGTDTADYRRQIQGL